MPEFEFIYKQRALIYDGTNVEEVLTYFSPLLGGFDNLMHDPEPAVDENDVLTIHYGGGAAEGPFDIVINPGDFLPISNDGTIATSTATFDPAASVEPRIVRVDEILNP